MANKKAPAAEELKSFLSYAILAASAHNTQPWRFSIEDGSIQIAPDMSRALDVADPESRELFISLGCAIANIEAAASHSDLAIEVAFPSRQFDSARVAFMEGKKEDGLFSALEKRKTNRGKYSDEPLPQDLFQECEKLCEPGVRLHFLTGAPRQEIADMVYAGDAQQFDDPRYRKELAYWIGEGALGRGKASDEILKFAVSHFNPGKSVAKGDRELILGSPVYAVLSAAKDDLEHWVKTGISYERIALYLTSRGIANQPMNQGLLEVPENRQKIGDMTKSGEFANFGFRIGYSEKPGHKERLRIKLEEVMR